MNIKKLLIYFALPILLIISGCSNNDVVNFSEDSEVVQKTAYEDNKAKYKIKWRINNSLHRFKYSEFYSTDTFAHVGDKIVVEGTTIKSVNSKK